MVILPAEGKHMKNHVLRYVLAILSITYLIGLAATVAIASSSPKSQPDATSSVAAKQNWDSLIVAAKKEGSVLIYTMWISETRIALTQAFKEKYGINLEFSPFNRGAEIMTKLRTEQRAGLYLADLIGVGAGTLVATMKPAGDIVPMENLLVLPEVTDGKYWRGGKVPFLDKDKTTIGMIASVQRSIIYNTNLIRKGEIMSFKDLLKPQYKGKITVNDPTVPGAGKDSLIHLALNVWNLEETKSYFTQLLKRQEAVIDRDNRQHVESVARGKYAIGFGPQLDSFAKFLEIGSPIDGAIPKEGAYVTSAAGCIAVPSKLAHPNATKLFINWLLGRDGQAIFAKSFGSPSMRNDVPTKQFNPTFLPQPQEKIYLANEASILFTDEMTKAANQIVDEAYK